MIDGLPPDWELAKRGANRDLLDTLRAIWDRMPFEAGFVVQGRKGVIKPFTEPDVHPELGPGFGFDVKYDDGSHVEFRVQPSGWGSPAVSVTENPTKEEP